MSGTKLNERAFCCAPRSFAPPPSWGLTVIALGIVLLSAVAAEATHLRYSHVTWIPRTDIDPNAIDLMVQSVWRRDAFLTGNDRCIDPATLVDIPCTGPGNAAGIGDVIHERQGDTRLDPGDSSGLIGGPGALSNALLYLVTSIDADNNWAFGVALDPASLPASAPPYDAAITHIYPAPGNYLADLEDCCRISECTAPNAHLNNPDSDYRVETRINVGSGNSSPVSTLPPIVLCPENGLCQFSVPVSDNELDPVSFRLSTTAESKIGSQPGAPQCPNAATVDSVTGLYSWDTTGCTLAGDPLPVPPDGGCGDPNLNSLYSTQVMIDEQGGASRVAVDFLIQLVPSCALGNVAPSFDSPPTPPCGTSLSINPGGNLSFDIQASDTDAGDVVELNAVGVPSGASMSPALPVSGQPVATTFSWTPSAAQEGQHVVSLAATDSCGTQTLCAVTIDVSREICTDGIDNDGDLLIDCADPDCAATPCDDSLFCTANDQCQSGVCTGAPRNCGDGNQCTADSCDEGANACVNDAVAADGDGCQDGQFCTDGDTCSGGACVSGGATDCSSAGDQCNIGTCNETSNQCEPEPSGEGSACDDESFCTVGEICVAGVCKNGGALDCSDGNSCTQDSCNEQGDECSNQALPGCCGNEMIELGEECDDGNQIDGDGCDADCTVSSACTFSHGGTPAELFVGACGAPSFADVQAAVDASADGDIVSVCPGTYTQPVQISAEVTLRSTAGAASTVLHTTGTTLDILRSGVSVEGLTLISDVGAAIRADAICPLDESGCPSSSGSNLRISDNVIRDSVAGIEWHTRVDCVEIVNNSFADNDAHISLLQAAGAPAVLVEVGGESGGVGEGNVLSGGGGSGVALEIAGIEVSIVDNTVENMAGAGIVVRDVFSSTPVTVAANTVRQAVGTGVAVSNIPPGSQLVENEIDSNGGDGIRIGAGAAGANVENNNITNNGVGLGNEAASGSLDATLNWWGSQTGPSGVFTGDGDIIVDRSGSTTQFVEFLCRPFPEGFASFEGVCSIETPELRQLLSGRRPDIDPLGPYLVFESSADIDVDPRTQISNADGGVEIFLLDREPRPKIGKVPFGGVCLGGLNPCDFDDPGSCATCFGAGDCLGEPGSDPITLNGDCVQITQLTDDPTGGDFHKNPRITGRGKDVVFATTTDLTGSNPDGSQELVGWNRKKFEASLPGGPFTALTDGDAGEVSDSSTPSKSGTFVAMESTGDPVPETTEGLFGNADGNREIYVYSPRKLVWFQITRTTGFCAMSGGTCLDDTECEGPGDTCETVENQRPSTIDGKRIVFDSTADLHNDVKRPGINNPDHNREIFLAKLKKNGPPLITQITDTVAPVENRSASGDFRAKRVSFTSNGNLDSVDPRNADGSREIFVWSRNEDSIAQITDASSGESINPVLSMSGRWMVFESTADLQGNGATNRRVFQHDRDTDEILTLSKARFGVNQLPRVRRRRFVTWESTANLTGRNPTRDWVIFVFDRKKED
jgi:nitrous oxidase accessory protein NosD